MAIYDDYGHHPVEIAAVLKAAKAGARGRVIAVVEPHRYTRVRDLFQEFAACFKDADSVIVTPLYSAGELPIDGVDHTSLAEAIRATGHGAVLTVRSEREIAPALKSFATSGDIVICLGAGNSTEWAHALPELARRRAQARRGKGMIPSRSSPTCAFPCVEAGSDVGWVKRSADPTLAETATCVGSSLTLDPTYEAHAEGIAFGIGGGEAGGGAP